MFNFKLTAVIPIILAVTSMADDAEPEYLRDRGAGGAFCDGTTWTNASEKSQ
jgi:hypothetical protein